jgi:tetratricopeptide (TPR) repeat protein
VTGRPHDTVGVYHYCCRGDIYYQLGKYATALADYDKAIELVPYRSYTYKRRALTHFQLRNYAQALADLARAGEVNIADPSFLWWIPFGQLTVCPDEGFRKGLLEMADKEVRWAQEKADPRIRGVVYLARARIQAAFGLDKGGHADMEQALHLAKDKPEGIFWLGGHLLDHKQWAETIEEWRWVIKYQPGLFFAHNNLGFALASQGKFQDAKEAYKLAIKYQPDNANLHYFLALIQLATGRRDDYRQDCAAMLQRFGQTDIVSNGYWTAWTCALAPEAVADWSKPIALADKAAKDKPKLTQYLNTLGALLYRAGRYEEAVQWLNEANRLVSDPTEKAETSPAFTWFFLAMAHQRLGHREQARREFDKAAQWTDKAIGKRDSGAGPRLNWDREIALKLFRAEAAQLLGVPELLSPPKEGKPQ